MDIQLGIIYWSMITLGLLVLVDRMCARNPALQSHRSVLRLAAMAWMLMPVLKKIWIDEILPPSDAIEHEYVAREIADLIHAGKWNLALGYLNIGNEAYDFLMGVLYSVTLAPEIITYTLHSALGFAGLLAVLEVGCLLTRCSSVPSSAVWITAFLPSGLLWCSANLKEGMTLWGLSMVMYWMVDPSTMRNGRRGMPLLGMLLAGAMRPHIMLMWLGAMGFAAVVKSRRYDIGVTAALAIAICFASLKVLAPHVYDVLIHEGLTASLAQKHSFLVDQTDLASQQFIGAKPIPVYTGLTLILFRPWPNEVFKIGELLAGVEVWTLSLWGLWNWRNPFRAMVHLKDANLLGLIVGLLLFGFFFSYMYNMGLVARQRLMAFPAVLLIYMWPLLALQTQPAVQTRQFRRIKRPTTGTFPTPRPVAVSS